MDARRTIEEIIALYSLEDSVRDIYVEGRSDKNFFSWFIGSGGQTNTEVVSIDYLEITNELLDKYGLSHGSNRSRIIAAAMAIKESSPDLDNALFIADRDYSDYMPEEMNNSILEFTDYNSIELYALNEETVRKVLSVLYGNYSVEMPNFYYEMKSILRDIFAIRLSNERLGWQMEWLDFRKYVLVAPRVTFKKDCFVEAYLKKNSKWSKRRGFEDSIQSCDQELKDDCRLSIRGHDFVSLFQYLMNKKFRKKIIHKEEVFQGILLSSLEKESLLREAMLQKIDEFSNNLGP